MKLLTFFITFVGALVLVRGCLPSTGSMAVGNAFGFTITGAVVLAGVVTFLLTRK